MQVDAVVVVARLVRGVVAMVVICEVVGEVTLVVVLDALVVVKLVVGVLHEIGMKLVDDIEVGGAVRVL